MSGSQTEPFSLDRRALTRSFDRAGAHYDQAARLQRQVRIELLERLQYFALTPRWILDLGAGTCQAAPALQQRFKSARVLSVDIAAGMLRSAPRRRWPRRRWLRVCADANALPLPDHSIELVFSNLMLQWCDRPQLVFSEVARVLKPGGLFVFTSFGPDTLRELRSAWEAADRGPHVSLFADMPLLGEAMMHAGLVEPVMDIEQHRLYYPEVKSLMYELKRIGARNAASQRARGLTGRARMHNMIAAYEQQRAPPGLPASYEVIFGAAFGGARAATAAASGDYLVPVSALRRGPR